MDSKQYIAALEHNGREVYRRTAPYRVTVPVGESGPWRVRRFETQMDITYLRCARDGRPPGLGEFTALSHARRGIVMSDTIPEIDDLLSFIDRLTGHVLISGLGLGMVVHILTTCDSFKSEVESITVLEKDADVIALTADHYRKRGVTVIHADALEWTPPKGSVYDAAWHDIWDSICGDNRPQMTALRRRYQRVVAKGLCPRTSSCPKSRTAAQKVWAALALVCLVAVWGGPQNPAFAIEPIGSQFERQKPTMPKRVSVFTSAPVIEDYAPALDRWYQRSVFVWDRKDGFGAYCRSGADNSSIQLNVFRTGGHKRLSCFSSGQGTFGGELVSRCLPRVFHLKDRIEGTILEDYVPCGDRNVSAQLLFGRLFSELDSIACCLGGILRGFRADLKSHIGIMQDASLNENADGRENKEKQGQVFPKSLSLVLAVLSGAIGLLLLGYGVRKSRDFPGYAALTVVVAWPFVLFAVWLSLVALFGWHLWPLSAPLDRLNILQSYSLSADCNEGRQHELGIDTTFWAETSLAHKAGAN